MFKKALIVLALLSMPQLTQAKLEDFLDRKELQKKIRDELAEQDITFGVDLGDIEVGGFKLGADYKYDVEASYMDKHFTRIDKWDVKGGINIGEILKDAVDMAPFSFSMNRNTSFVFVRQFADKKEALKATPYTPHKLPINSKAALKHLLPGDLVSMPANLNIAVGASASTSWVAPMVVNANVAAFFVLSGEFIIQVYKIDESHVRLKLITQRGRNSGSNYSMSTSFDIFGIRILDRQIERLFEKDLIQLGFAYNPGAQFIVDYVFDLKNDQARAAYDQILSSTYKFKDLVVADMLFRSDLKDKLISTYEKAEELFNADKELPIKERRVHRIFKGFNDYSGYTRHMKFSLLVTGYTNDKTLTEAKVTYIDKNEKNMEFFYPTYSKYSESYFGKKFFKVKDQTFQNNFGLLPRFNAEDTAKRNPELGFTFERKDRFFTAFEQKAVQKFIEYQLPTHIAKEVDFSQWHDDLTKSDSRIFFQLILKSQGFDYLKGIPADILRKKLGEYIKEKKDLYDLSQQQPDSSLNTEDTSQLSRLEKLKDFLFINRFIEREMLDKMASKLSKILNNTESSSEEKLRQLVTLNQQSIFNRIGVGFLISLLPQEKLNELIYIKLNLIAKDLKAVEIEYGTLNYKAVYNELTLIQSRLSNRGYDLRFNESDRDMSDRDADGNKNLEIPMAM